ncbi:hypothetical protein CPAL_01200 [Clostridium thermopalmarium DSM 5974]|uniref:Uncharacterized protein n=3 Tax=Clostridiaceae TaxID=31979 RepID=A0A151ARL9_9CLOT|nr:hypothetical protein CLCOL_01760 [Clostridium colicanis DSM 13634]PRR76729.1 hypothetical protein CPAL_01200 [Clostridium thermopalmarium DSM 5974]PVZ23064.1 hypothetical protein LX19_01727 [Clostridium thermopalmarium DSM 5974]
MHRIFFIIRSERVNNMKIELADSELIIVLRTLINEHMEAKRYYEDYTAEEDRVGITSPEEIEQIYNSILKQAQEQGKFTNLSPIGIEKTKS